MDVRGQGPEGDFLEILGADKGPRALRRTFSPGSCSAGGRHRNQTWKGAAARRSCSWYRAEICRLSRNVRFTPDFFRSTPRCGLSGWRCRWSEPDPKETLTLLLSATGEHLGSASGSVPRNRTQRDPSLPTCPPGPTSPNCPAMPRSARLENTP